MEIENVVTHLLPKYRQGNMVLWTKLVVIEMIGWIDSAYIFKVEFLTECITGLREREVKVFSKISL